MPVAVPATTRCTTVALVDYNDDDDDVDDE